MNANVKNIRLGDIIDLRDEVNAENAPYPVLGLNKEKSFIPTVANLSEIDLRKYKVVQKNWFAFSGMQTGRDVCIRIARYTEESPAIISPAYTTFTIRECYKGRQILDSYIFLFFNRRESDRYGAFISDSSVRANLDWPRFCDIEIPLPDIEIQRQLVNVWEGLNSMKQDNEAQAEPLMELCMSYLKKLRKNYPLQSIGGFIAPIDERNSDNKYKEDSVRGIATSKQFIVTKANLEGVSLSSYKLVPPNSFAFVADTSRRGDKMSLAFNDSPEVYLVSSISTVFEVLKCSDLLPEYLYLWFLRPEFDRYARFHSWGSARETFDLDDMKRVSIPIPPKPIQQAVVDIYNCAKESKAIAEQAEQLRRIAGPALMQKAINN